MCLYWSEGRVENHLEKTSPSITGRDSKPQPPCHNPTTCTPVRAEDVEDTSHVNKKIPTAVTKGSECYVVAVAGRKCTVCCSFLHARRERLSLTCSPYNRDLNIMMLAGVDQWEEPLDALEWEMIRAPIVNPRAHWILLGYRLKETKQLIKCHDDPQGLTSSSSSSSTVLPHLAAGSAVIACRWDGHNAVSFIPRCLTSPRSSSTGCGQFTNYQAAPDNCVTTVQTKKKGEGIATAPNVPVVCGTMENVWSGNCNIKIRLLFSVEWNRTFKHEHETENESNTTQSLPQQSRVRCRGPVCLLAVVAESVLTDPRPQTRSRVSSPTTKCTHTLLQTGPADHTVQGHCLPRDWTGAPTPPHCSNSPKMAPMASLGGITFTGILTVMLFARCGHSAHSMLANALVVLSPTAEDGEIEVRISEKGKMREREDERQAGTGESENESSPTTRVKHTPDWLAVLKVISQECLTAWSIAL
uniref:Uncharacterized protein n=1 Tax=Timema cristinae TaxID=61476 RepID=A0A7R9CCY0_TIMCR|nr:unnamed protein product [Timema cristinae]